MPVFSRIYGWLMRRKRPRFLVRQLIDLFKTAYRIDMDEYVGSETDYACLADFFIRPLDLEKRPLLPRSDAVVSPADGVLEALETIYEDKCTQVKGEYFAVSELLQETIDFPAGWHVATIYLSPKNYHRFHYPCTGKISGYCHVPGSLFPVNALGMTLVKKLFVRNERIVTRFAVNGAPLYMAAVGACFVGSIRMRFIDKIRRDKRWKELDLKVDQSAEMGYFAMGSTIILVVPRGLGEPITGLLGQPVKVGDPLFLLHTDSRTRKS